MVKDLIGKTVEVGDLAAVIPGLGGFISAIVQEVTPPLTVPGGPQQGVQKVRLLAIIDLPPVPAGAVFTGISVTDKNQTPEAEKYLENIKKSVAELKVGSGAGTLLVR